MLSYQLQNDGRDGRIVVITLKLLRGEEGAIATSLHQFYSYHMEHVWVNPSRFPNYLSQPCSARPKLRATRNHGDDIVTLQKYSMQRLKSGVMNSLSHDVVVSNAISRLGGRKERKRKREMKFTGKPAFTSVEQAAHDNTLFHSVVQNKLNTTCFDDGYDSDDPHHVNQQWRLQIMDDEIEEYIDTVAVEKLFMNLWNQFVTMEHRITADHEIANACIQFAKRYRNTMTRLCLRPTFLRHLTEVWRRGLLDCDAVFEALTTLGSDVKDDAEEGRFLFAERFEKQEMKRRRLEAAKEAAEQVSRPNTNIDN